MKTVCYFLITGLVALSLTATCKSVYAAAGPNNVPGMETNIGQAEFSPSEVELPRSSYIANHARDMIRLHGVGGTVGETNSDDYISFSYEGSSGALGFSSGYIYAVDNWDMFGLEGTAPFDERRDGYQVDGGKNIYVGLDVTHSIHLADDVVLDMKAGFIYLNDIYSERENRAVSLLFVMPLTLNDSLTIAPKFHWERYLADYTVALDKEDVRGNDDPEENAGSFYGGLSISLAY